MLACEFLPRMQWEMEYSDGEWDDNGDTCNNRAQRGALPCEYWATELRTPDSRCEQTWVMILTRCSDSSIIRCVCFHTSSTGLRPAPGAASRGPACCPCCCCCPADLLHESTARPASLHMIRTWGFSVSNRRRTLIRIHTRGSDGSGGRKHISQGRERCLARPGRHQVAGPRRV